MGLVDGYQSWQSRSRGVKEGRLLLREGRRVLRKYGARLQPAQLAKVRFKFSEATSLGFEFFGTQATLDAKGVAILQSEVGKAAETIAALEKAGAAQSMRARIGELKISLNNYATTTEAYIKYQQQVHDLYVNKIAPQTKDMQASTAEARTQLQAAFSEARMFSDSSIGRTVKVQEIIGALTLVITNYKHVFGFVIMPF